MAAYATATDMLLGDLEVASSIDKDTYLERASRDIDVWLSQVYDTPFTMTAGSIGETILKNATADLATAYLILAVAQGGEDNRINAYGKWLYDRAMGVIGSYLDGTKLLPGATPVVDPSATAAVGPVAIYQEDSSSGVAEFYRFVQSPSPYPPYVNYIGG